MIPSNLPRPLTHLRRLQARYPEACHQARRFREMRGQGLDEWAEWCYLPLAGAYAIVSGGSKEPLSPQHGVDISAVGALTAWSETQGIYLYDETLLGALWDTPVTGDLPTEVLRCLPEWCVYVQLPAPRPFGSNQLHGWFAHLEHDQNDGRQELRLLLDETFPDGSEALAPIALHLEGNLQEAIRGFVGEARHQIERDSRLTDEERALLVDHVAGGEMERVLLSVEPLVSVLLYLCSTASEITARATNQPHPRLRGIASRRPKAPTTWDVGVRLGAALAAGLARSAQEEAPTTGAHASPRPHVRRAHWHHYWTGARDSANRQLEIRWLPPIPVNIDQGAIVPTMHKVQ